MGARRAPAGEEPPLASRHELGASRLFDSRRVYGAWGSAAGWLRTTGPSMLPRGSWAPAGAGGCGTRSSHLGFAATELGSGLALPKHRVLASCALILQPPACLVQEQIGLSVSPSRGGDLVPFLLVCNVNILIARTLPGAGCHVEERDSFMLLLLGAQ